MATIGRSTAEPEKFDVLRVEDGAITEIATFRPSGHQHQGATAGTAPNRRGGCGAGRDLGEERAAAWRGVPSFL